MNETNPERPIVLFDGACNFCNASINFLVRHGAKEVFLLVPFQSAYATELMKKFNLQGNNFQSVILIEDKIIYYKSTAVLRVIRKLRPLIKWFYVFIFVPKFLRDPVYDWIAKHRNRWFGKQNSCVVPNE